MRRSLNAGLFKCTYIKFHTVILVHYCNYDITTHTHSSSSEATVRFLKAKLRVMQEEMDRLLQENREKVCTLANIAVEILSKLIYVQDIQISM